MRPFRFRAKTIAVAIGDPFVNAALGTFGSMDIAFQAVKTLAGALTDLGVLVARFDVLILKTTRLVMVASFAAGAVMALQFGAGMARFGATTYVATVVSKSITEALGPMLAALMVASRSGGGLAAEIGGMVVTQQIDAIKTLGSDPYRKFFTPSIFVLIIGLPILTVLADFAGLCGGLLIEMTTLSLPFVQSVTKTLDAIDPKLTGLAVLKTAVSGAVIGVLATREGLRAERGTSGIGLATTAAVVKTTIGVLIADLILTKLIWLIT